MVKIQSERLLSLLLKWGRAFAESETEDTTEVNKGDTAVTTDGETEPMTVYWESDKDALDQHRQKYIDSFLNDVALDRIPDTTAKPITESRYDYDRLSLVFLPELKNLNVLQTAGVTEGVPKPGTGISSSGRDAGVVAGIVVAVISGVIILAALIAGFMYRHYMHRNVTSMNFDNPVYRKTTEDQFALEKNGYAPGSKLYPSTVGEEVRALTAMECTLNIQNSLR